VCGGGVKVFLSTALPLSKTAAKVLITKISPPASQIHIKLPNCFGFSKPNLKLQTLLGSNFIKDP
jgi:hypothetical protein